jgi:TatD DNase family protein
MECLEGMTGLIDTHAHLDRFHKNGSLAGVLARAREARVDRIITIGTEPEDWALYASLVPTLGGAVSFTVGLHPCSVDAGWESAVAQIEGYFDRTPRIESEKCGSGFMPDNRGDAVGDEPRPTPGTELQRATPVAIGECGLDRFHLPKDPAEAEPLFAMQREAFAAQLAIAKRRGLPVVVHSRGAFQECVAMVDASGTDWSRVVFHCFSEGEVEMRGLMERGGWGSFTGILTYKTAEPIRAACRLQGIDRLMVETDAPYLAPAPNRGKPNEPAWVRFTADCAAGVLGVTPDEAAAASTRNAVRFFGIT